MAAPLPPRQIARRPLSRHWVVRASREHGAQAPAPDAIAVEEPLEIRVASDTFATLMRTPGEDHFLTAGFLFSEGIIRSVSDLGRVAHCGRPTDQGYGNLIDVAPGPGTALAPELAQVATRNTVASSACGSCGRERIDDLLARMEPVRDARVLAVELIGLSLSSLRDRQSAFAQSGAMHGALVCDPQGEILACSEDVGRHNAVDKVIGKLLYANELGTQPQRAFVLAVSGRTSFEIVQKAALAGLACVVSVSAPTSLAIQLADALGLTLVGFARGSAFNVYAHPERLRFA